MSQLTTLRRAIGRGIMRAFDLQSLWLQGIEVPWSPGYGGGSSTQAAYQNSATAYACIRRKALDVASAPMLFRRGPEDDAAEVERNHPIRALWSKPLPWFSREQVLQFMVTFLEMRGECFLDFDDPMRPREMVPYYDPSCWKHTKNEQGRLIGWSYTREAHVMQRLPSDVLHHRYVSPTEPYRGQSPLLAAAKDYAIETGLASLNANIIERGGERGILYEVDPNFTPEQRKQADAFLQGRRTMLQNKVPRDVLLPTGVKVIDPRFLEEDMAIFAQLPKSEERICNVYGVPNSLLSGKDDNYATFRGRLKIYWSSTLVPLIRGLESTFDLYFGQLFGVYVRFDLSRIEALKDNIAERAAVAVQLKGTNLPWRQIEAVVGLGVDVDEIPEADDVLVNGLLYPARKLFEEAENPAPPPPPPAAPVAPGQPPAPNEPTDDDDAPTGPAKPPGKATRAGPPPGLTNRAIQERARDPREVLTRTRRLAKMERELKSAWRGSMGKWKHDAVAKVEDASPAEAVEILRSLQRPVSNEMVKLIKPYHLRAAREGVTSILLIAGKAQWSDQQTMADADLPPLSDKAREWVAKRENRIRDMGKRLFRDVVDSVQEAVLNGATSAELGRLVAQRFDVSGVRAATIARTEVGTAYNTSRFFEMGEQGFEKHIWVTAEDELVRGNDPGDEFDHAQCDGEVRLLNGDDGPFPCGLYYPMEEGGEAGNTINCRCEARPYVDEAA